jgi:hypothetical protein
LFDSIIQKDFPEYQFTARKHKTPQKRLKGMSLGYFITVNPFDIQGIRRLLKNCHSNTISRYEFTIETTKKGVPHLHLNVEFKKPKSWAKMLEVFTSFEDPIASGYGYKYKIVHSNYDDPNLRKYVRKVVDRDINFRKENNLLDIYTNDEGHPRAEDNAAQALQEKV